MAALTRERIKAVLAEKTAARFKPRTVKGHLDVLRACLTAAIEDRLLPANPAARLGRFVPRAWEEGDVETFTREEPPDRER